MTSKEYGALFLLSALWGGSFLFMRIAAPALGPIVLIELRVGLAALALLAYGLLIGKVPEFRRHWRAYAVAGAVNSAFPFLLFSTAALYIPASLMATLNATTPLWGVIVAAIWLRETLTVRKVAGLLLGFAGVATLVGLGPVALTPSVLLGCGAALLASFLYANGAVYVKVNLQGVDSRAIATYSQLFAALLILPLVPFAIPSQPPTAVVTASVLALSLLSTALAYLLFFYLILQAGP
ncbi:MAG: DMT family transporter, partial [Bacillota bacterium]